MNTLEKISTRIDGRNYNHSRPVKIFYNPICSSFGSVQITIGFTSVIISMYKKSNFNQNEARIPDINLFLVKFKKKIKKLKSIKNMIMHILSFLHFQKQIKNKISLNLFILSEDGNLATVILNGISVAIRKANLFRFDFFFSNVSLLKNFIKFIIDPRSIEEIFTCMNCYFIISRCSEKKDYKFKILYQGQLNRFNRRLCEKIIRFGKRYVNLIQIL